MHYITHSPEDTEKLGAALAQRLQPGTIIAYTGDLGAGKTAFTRGLAKGLGYTQPVTSPTYTIVNEYLGGGCPCSILICTGWPPPMTCGTSAGRTIWSGAACAPWNGAKTWPMPWRVPFGWTLPSLATIPERLPLKEEMQMQILAFETSAKAASVALVQDGKLLGESYQNTGMTHSQTLMVMVEDLLHQCGVTVSQLDGVAVANGPGSFTGIRIGVAAAKGFAWGRSCPASGSAPWPPWRWGWAHGRAMYAR